MRQYHDLLKDILGDGTRKMDRTGAGTLSVFGHQMRFDLTRGFPLVTTKKLHFKSIAHELIWFLAGDTNVEYLHKHGVSIWDEWADANGELGPVYGRQWRSWRTPDGSTIDQITKVVSDVRSDPDSRRLIVTAWNPAHVDKMALPPCHCLFQFYVANGRLSCQLYQRSADVFIGVPFNIASYALLTLMMAQVTGLKAGEFVHTLGDAHLYRNHLEPTTTRSTRLILNSRRTSFIDYGSAARASKSSRNCDGSRTRCAKHLASRSGRGLSPKKPRPKARFEVGSLDRIILLFIADRRNRVAALTRAAA